MCHGFSYRCDEHECVAGGMHLLQTVAPNGLNAVTSEEEWQEIELAVDSGATESVVHEDMATNIATVPGEASRRGVSYKVANGEQLPNLGEKIFEAVSENHVLRKMTAQVCDVDTGLLSVSKAVEQGNRVVFDNTGNGQGSYIEDKETGEFMPIQLKGGMFMLKLWVRKAADF